MHACMVATNKGGGDNDVGKLLGVQFTSGRLGDACETGRKSLHSASVDESTDIRHGFQCIDDFLDA